MGSMSKTIAALTATLALALLWPAAAGAAGPRQVASLTYTSQVPGTPTGFVGDMSFQNPENPTLKPHTLKRMALKSPAGSVIDTTVPPQCHASDAQLMIQGPAACPRDTQIGWGLSVSDNGAGGPFPPYTQAKITRFHHQDEGVGGGVPKQLPAGKLVGRPKI